MTILITGGAGFIGSNLADKLIERGDRVVIVDNLETGREDNIHSDCTFFKEDISNLESMEIIFNNYKPDVVVHAAASYKDPNDYKTDVITNCLGGANIAYLCKKHGVKRVIYFQTSCAYGHAPEQQPVKPEYPLLPDNSSYAITKTTAEYFLKLFKLDYIAFRLANCYGPRNLTGPIPTFFKKLASGATCTVVNTRRDYIFIDDLVRVVIRAIDGEGKSGPYHISTGSDYSIKELYENIAKIMGVTESPIEKERGEDDTATLLIDPTKTEQDFPGWKANTDLRDGLFMAIDWYNSHSFDKIYTHLRMK